MKLLERYALQSGTRIGKQHLVESFYPLPFERYVTIQGGSGMAAKNYPHYGEVLALLAEPLKAAGIAVVQIGGKEDHALPGCYHLQGQTNLHQSNHVLRGALCHIGNDSWLSHRGGALGVPLVVSFGPTSVANHSPYQFDPRSVFIESHRFGRRPTFAAQEHPSTMAVIPPEQISSAVLQLLGLTSTTTTTRKSLYIGEAYHQPVVELVPNVVLDPRMQLGTPLILRMDLADGIEGVEDKILGNLQVRPCAIITDRELNLSHLAQLKPRIAGLRVEVGKVSEVWIKTVKRLGIQTAFFSNEQDPEKLARLRLDLYDACLFDHYVAPTRADFVKGVEAYTNGPIDMESIIGRIEFKTNRLLLSDGRIYLSEAHWRAGRPVSANDQRTDRVIDEPLFWENVAHLYCYIT